MVAATIIFVPICMVASIFIVKCMSIVIFAFIFTLHSHIQYQTPWPCLQTCASLQIDNSWCMSLGLDKYIGPQFQAPAKQAICENLHVRRTNTGTRIYSKQIFVMLQPSRGHRKTKPLHQNAPKHMHKKLDNIFWILILSM